MGGLGSVGQCVNYAITKMFHLNIHPLETNVSLETHHGYTKACQVSGSYDFIYESDRLICRPKLLTAFSYY